MNRQEIDTDGNRKEIDSDSNRQKNRFRNLLDKE